jgi:DNA-binding CsgD family transcriptional regulator
VLAADTADELGAPPPGAAACAATAGQLTELLKVLRGPLTVAEATALKLAADGCTNVRIAHELGISVSGVKARLESSFLKLNAADRTHAVALALRNDWIS